MESNTDTIKAPANPLEASLSGLAQVIDHHGNVLSELMQRLQPIMKEPSPTADQGDVAGYLGESDLVRTIEINSRNIQEQTEMVLLILSRLEM